MKLYSARPDSPVVSLFRQRPMQMGTEEFIYPARTVLVPPGFSEWADADAKNVLEMFGPSGVVQVKGDKPDDAVINEAKRVRHQFLVRQLMVYRQSVDAQTRAGTPATMPSPYLYAAAAEFKELDGWVKKNDPVFSVIGALPMATPAETVDEVINGELRKFGVAPPGSVPVTANPNPATDLPI